jgi:hypothetical protein
MGAMGHAGKWREQVRARQLRAQSWTLQQIADELGVSKASVSVWVRDVAFTPMPPTRRHGPPKPHPLRTAKLAEIERCRAEAEALVGELSHSELRMFALGLYAGEDAKTGVTLSIANTNPILLVIFLSWLRCEFEVDESRLRARLYLHEGLDLDAAMEFWSSVLAIPPEQFQRPYRAAADPTRRTAKHALGCATVIYSSALLHRRVMAMIAAVASRFDIPG